MDEPAAGVDGILVDLGRPEPGEARPVPFAAAARAAADGVLATVRRRPALLWGALFLGTGLGLWASSLPSIATSGLDDYGLLPVLPPAWFVGVGLLVLGGVVSLCLRRSIPALQAVFVFALILALYGTVPLITPEPQYSWVYKHIGVVRFIEVGGRLNPNLDIYNHWPGFFAAAALFTVLGGRPNPVSYVAWAEIFFMVVDVVLIVAIVRKLTEDTRKAWGTALVFTVTNWIGQNYYSPQALDLTLVLAIYLLIVSYLGVPADERRTGRVIRSLQWLRILPRSFGLPPSRGGRQRRQAVVLLLVLDAAAVISHQLSPYMLLFGIAALVLARMLRPFWLIAAVALITVGFLLPNLDYVARHFGLFSGLDLLKNAAPPSGAVPDAMPGKVFHGQAGQYLSLGVWALMCVGFVRRRRRSDPVVVPVALLAIAPMVTAAGQNYGGEGILRIYLFSLPWASLLIVWALEPASGVWRVRRVPVVFAVIGALTALFLPAFFGQEELNIIPPDEVTASQYFYTNGQSQAGLVLVGGAFPLRYGSTYGEFYDSADLSVVPGICGHHTDQELVGTVVTELRQQSPHAYLLFSTTGAINAEVLGYCGAPGLARLESVVAHSARFALWYHNPNTRIYQLQ